MNLKLKNIQHVGIPVSDLEKSEKFYKTLGFKNVMQSTFKHKNDTGKVVMMKSGKIIMELYQMPENELKEIRLRKNGHIDHIAFDVADIDATFAQLKNSGYTIDESAPVFLAFWEKGCKYFNLIGPDGERLEFNQIL